MKLYAVSLYAETFLQSGAKVFSHKSNYIVASSTEEARADALKLNNETFKGRAWTNREYHLTEIPLETIASVQERGQL